MASKLRGLAKKSEATKKSKSSHPVLELGSTEENGRLVIKWIEAKRDESGGKTRRGKEEEFLLPVADKIHKDHCLKNKEYQSMIKLTCNLASAKKAMIAEIDEKLKTTTDAAATAVLVARKAEIVAFPDDARLKFSPSPSYSKIPEDDEETLKEKAGKRYDELFAQKVTIALTDKGVQKVVEDERLIDKLIELLGGDDCVEVGFHIEPTELFSQLRRVDPEVIKMADALIKAKLVKPYKSSFKED